jgi:hypothetical protein
LIDDSIMIDMQAAAQEWAQSARSIPSIHSILLLAMEPLQRAAPASCPPPAAASESL